MVDALLWIATALLPEIGTAVIGVSVLVLVLEFVFAIKEWLS